MTPSTQPLFWRNAGMPYVELRQVLDGRLVSYALHSHQQWSVGAILDGQSEFVCHNRLHYVQSGALVMMNPDVVHACNPQQNSPWAYYMMHLDKNWLAAFLHTEGVRSQPGWFDTTADTLSCPQLFAGFVAIAETLRSPLCSVAEKDAVLRTYLRQLFLQLDNHSVAVATLSAPDKLYRVADYLATHCEEDTAIDTVSAAFGLSTGYLMRAFKRHFNMTPHAYRLNRRVQMAQDALKQGKAIAAIAHDTGFSDQPHFQRVFKQRVAATPAQYRSVELQQQQDTAKRK
ncbi:MAG: AraC family transcriptional regulator [Gammaproteobacteria bacterium]|nr:AraC family transcriptional regulator [Gammaproteobacteria bacterium]MBU1554811.1 AraC family transcriptional regulator [Gammaproteobacteria bacterium]MBU2070269.1 AraC family transcriptional regulator [Gammaproteobacteria bacterium]MBU2183972.1 AraC family transcriptional regulator [Gammaproteobacteria bacterium]MBU2206776.1 AraC family transcriptional regulator [Gammaproteobacteria bacterium]